MIHLKNGVKNRNGYNNFKKNGVIESGFILVMIENGVKYGMMNGVKGHPLGPSFAVAAAGLHRRHTATGAPR